MNALTDARLTCTVPEAGRLLGIGRDAAYAAAARGDIPTLRIGRRLLVPLGKLHELVGMKPLERSGRGSTPGAATPLQARPPNEHVEGLPRPDVSPPVAAPSDSRLPTGPVHFKNEEFS